MAYGARLESALGESPRGFESPILRVRSERVARLADRNHHWCVKASDSIVREEKAPEKSGAFVILCSQSHL